VSFRLKAWPPCLAASSPPPFFSFSLFFSFSSHLFFPLCRSRDIWNQRYREEGAFPLPFFFLFFLVFPPSADMWRRQARWFSSFFFDIFLFRTTHRESERGDRSTSLSSFFPFFFFLPTSPPPAGYVSWTSCGSSLLLFLFLFFSPPPPPPPPTRR